MLTLSGLHLLLGYQCTLECDHCFVWGSPWQRGVMTLETIQLILDQAAELESVTSIAFEGGEPFLYYATLRKGVEEAVHRGYAASIVTNAFWATSEADALEALQPFARLLKSLTVSSDLYHWSQPLSQQAQNAASAAAKLGIPSGLISIARPEREAASAVGQLPYGEGKVMYRGRAALKLVEHAPRQPWTTFDACPHENLRQPGRVHLDALGNVHICQGIILGNFLQQTLKEICTGCDPDAHPIVGPILRGGPAELAREYGGAPDSNKAEVAATIAKSRHGMPTFADSSKSSLFASGEFADACHLCYETRVLLRERFPAELGPGQMYGELNGG